MYYLNEYAQNILMMPLQLVSSIVIMYQNLGIVFLCGLGVIFLMGLTNYFIGKSWLEVYKEMMKEKDSRIKV
jgi:hypothetical protein